MDPLKQQQLSMPVVEVFLSVEEELLLNVANLLKKHQSLLTEDGIQSWQAEQLAQLESLTQRNIITIAKHAGLSIDAVTEMLEEAGYGALEVNEGSLTEAVQQGLLVKAPAIASSTALQAVMISYQNQAKETFNLVNSTLLDQSRQIYLDIINQTVGKVLAGTTTPQEVLRGTARKWAEKGVPALIDKAGRQWSTEAYINAVVRSMSNNVANDMQDTRMDEYGADLVEISSHSGARPKCAKYQGRIFSRSGRHPKYPSLSSTSYGEPDGLFGINCRHVKYPFIEGITKRTYKSYPAEENRKVYEQSQQQRYLERRIRQAKRELNMMSAIGDDFGIKMAKQRVRERQATMREFIAATGRGRHYQREQIY
ncbi:MULTISPECIES: phage minor capsid protein [Bacillaceae]|uniref:phage minor capsid protein n=1 Tax=Bacillaceae TaxID=186817 RepID=UPI0013D624A6|nr:phage minor capsid protein [Bacillus sp. 22-7]